MAQDLCDRVAIIDKGRLLADRPVHELLGLFRQDQYEISVEGTLDGNTASLAGLTVTRAEGSTVISGSISEQDDLHDILGMMRRLGLPILSVERAAPGLKEVFLRLVEREGTKD